jgi:hypothetical protein
MEMPVAAAKERGHHWLLPLVDHSFGEGFAQVCNARLITSVTESSSSVRALPGRSSSWMTSKPSSRNHLRHLPTIMTIEPLRLAINVLVSPAPKANIIWARWMIESGKERELAVHCC